ncbi:MAG TPA: DMT family transporter [Acidimicrobiales bacterium]|nr:DMT family transporter [Acidimicrobiales bacterium]
MRRPYLLLAGVTASWGTIPVLAGWANLPAPLIVAIRLWTAAACLGAVLLVQHWGSRRSPRTGGRGPRLLAVRPGLCALAGLTLAAHWLALFAAYKRAPAGTVILIVYLAPLGVAALSPRLLGERISRVTVAALGLATVGFCLVAAPTVRAAGTSGLILSLLAAALFVVLILVSKPLAAAYGGLRLAFIELAGAGVVLVPVALASAWPAPAAGWWWIVVLGVVHTAVGIAAYLGVLAEVPATHVGILGYLEPVAVVAAAWIWLGQRPALLTVAGGLLVVAAGAVVAAFGAGARRPARRTDRPPLGERSTTGEAAVPSS